MSRFVLQSAKVHRAPSGPRIERVTSGRIEVLRDREPHHEGLERMLVDVSAAIGIGGDLIVQTIDVPELCGGCTGVEEVVQAQRHTPPLRQGVMDIQVELSESFAVDLAERSWRVGA